MAGRQLDQRLRRLVVEASRHSTDNPKRRAAIDEIVRLVLRSTKQRRESTP